MARRWGAIGAAAMLALAAAMPWEGWFPKRLAVVEAGRIIRGAWQGPGPLERIIARDRIRTIVTLTAINRDDPKYVAQAKVVARTGVRWILVPMRGSRATPAQMVEAADLLADPALQPVFFHCVAGHHRTSLAHAAYLIRHRGFSADRAWAVVAGLPWTRPGATADLEDRRLIEDFAAREAGRRAGPDPGGAPCQLSRVPPPSPTRRR